jgi:hypothetical protein
MHRIYMVLVVAVHVVLLAGCGGGSTPTGTTQAGATGRAVLTVTWPTRSRLVPAASNSIRVVVKQGSVPVEQRLLPRPAGGGMTTASFDALPVGALNIGATAYPGADGSGVAQATVTAPLAIQAGQTTSFALTMASTIDHLELTANSQLYVGDTVQPLIVAKDSAGAVVLLSAGKLQWQSTDTAVATVDSSGLVTGPKAGTASISVTDTESQKFTALTLTVVTPAMPDLYDGFAYTTGAGVSGQNGGTGNWGGAWNEFGQGYTSSVIQAGSLAFVNLKTTGNSVLTTSDKPVGHARRFAVPATYGTTGTTLYISYLVEPIDALNAGSPDTYFSLVFGRISIGKGGHSDFYGLENDGSGGTYYASNVKAVPGQPVFLVARFRFLNGSDKCELWVNPTPGQPLPVTPSATKSDTDTGIPADFNIGSSIKTVFDEIRFGPTWESVSPIK